MASGIVRSAIASILDEADFSMQSENALRTKQLASCVLEAISQDENKMDCFDAFSTEILVKIQAITTHSQHEHKNCKRDRERAWTLFHALRVSELPLLWRCLFNDLNIQESYCTGKSDVYN